MLPPVPCSLSDDRRYLKQTVLFYMLLLLWEVMGTQGADFGTSLSLGSL